jgi:tetratricopeptide (TPR) repeat protein
MSVEQGTYYDTLGDVAAADAAFAKAAKLQDPAKREVDLVLVEVYARRGEVKRAIEALDAAMASSPTLPGLLRLADLHLVAQDAAGASKVLERVRPMAGDKASQEVQRQIEMLASGIAATEAEILRRDGKIAEAQKKVEDALAALTRAETVAPADLVAPLRRVQLLRALAVGQQDPARLEQAITEADRALARNALYWQMVSTRADLALDKRDIKAAIGIIERFLEAQPASEEARIRLMEMQLAAGSGDRAVETARGGIRLRPQDPRWAERLGDLLEATGDQAGAATEYERAFSLDPKSMGYLEKAALARLNAGGAADTLALLRGANELVQRSPVLRAIGAAALARSGRRDDALVAGREALSAARAAKADDLLTAERTVLMLREMFPPEKPADFEAYLTQAGAPSAVESALLADAWARSGPAGADKALEWCGKIEAQGESVPPGVRASAAMTRGGALYGKGDLPAATDAFVAAATISPRNAAALNNAAYLVAKVKGDNAKAFEFASKAVVLAPAQPDYLDTLGYVLMRSGRMAEAEDALNKSVAVSPTASALMHLAQLRAAQGNFGEARQIVDRAKARPADPDTAKELQEFAASLQGK